MYCCVFTSKQRPNQLSIFCSLPPEDFNKKERKRPFDERWQVAQGCNSTCIKSHELQFHTKRTNMFLFSNIYHTHREGHKRGVCHWRTATLPRVLRIRYTPFTAVARTSIGGQKTSFMDICVGWDTKKQLL